MFTDLSTRRRHSDCESLKVSEIELNASGKVVFSSQIVVSIIHTLSLVNFIDDLVKVYTVWTIEIGVRGGHPPFDYRVK